MKGHEAHEMLNGGFTLTIGSGETYDIVITAEDKRIPYRSYIVYGKDGIASLCKQMAEIRIEDPNDKFFPQFYPMHNHDDYKATNNGAYPGGQLTLIQVDAPDKCHPMEDEQD